MTAELPPNGQAFHSRIRTLWNIEAEDLIAAGAFAADDGERISNFISNPVSTFIRADDRTAAAIWSIVEARSNRRA